jgi:hypothetical protein
MTRVYDINGNPREKHDVDDDDGSYGSFCNTEVYALVEDMDNGANTFYDFGYLFFWYVSLGTILELLDLVMI